MAQPRSRWYGKKQYFGLHYDLHAGETDTVLGTRCGLEELTAMLKAMNPDFVQTDTKGHAGYTSWFSKTKDASVPPHLTGDALKQWRAATKKLGLPLHCHYSGIWDIVLAKKRPEWCVVAAPKKEAAQAGQNFCDNPSQKMCPRSGYVTEFMIPQMIELIDDYQVDGFWIDGDMWAAEPCYCERCRKAWTEETGIAEPPVEESDANWPRWWTFTLDSFNEYVTKYCDAVHAHKADVLVCSNWLQTFANPGEPAVPTDWISGDNSWAFGMDGSRCEARFLSTRKKHWDIMLWNFTKAGGMNEKTAPWYAKPVQMLMQEAAVLMSYGGHVQLYENPGTASPILRNGQLVPWRQKRMGAVGRFVKARRTLCQDTETIPQIAVLHSEYYIRHMTRGKNLMWNADCDPVRGAVFALAEKQFGVDVLDEWALLPRLAEFPVVVVPERHVLSPEMIAALKAYVENGGKLLVTGADSLDTFGADFFGVEKGESPTDRTYHVPAGDGAAPIYSMEWQLLKPGRATVVAPLYETAMLEEYATAYPAATLHSVGKGKVAYIPMNIMRDYKRNRNPLQRDFIAHVITALAGRFAITVDAPSCVDVALRRKGGKQMVHFVNRNTGLPTGPGCPTIDEIPSVGPLTVTIKMATEPKHVELAFEEGAVTSKYARGVLTVTVPSVHIHAALVVE